MDVTRAPLGLGDASGALALFQALLSDRERVLGADHPDTLSTRNNIASWTSTGRRIRKSSRSCARGA